MAFEWKNRPDWLLKHRPDWLKIWAGNERGSLQWARSLFRNDKDAPVGGVIPLAPVTTTSTSVGLRGDGPDTDGVVATVEQSQETPTRIPLTSNEETSSPQGVGDVEEDNRFPALIIESSRSPLPPITLPETRSPLETQRPPLQLKTPRPPITLNTVIEPLISESPPRDPEHENVLQEIRNLARDPAFFVNALQYKPKDPAVSTAVGQVATRAAVVLIPKREDASNPSEELRAKSPKYGGVNINHEAVAGALHRLVGNAPQVRIAFGVHQAGFEFNSKTRDDYVEGRNPATYPCIVSTMNRDFKDLGVVLRDESLMRDLIDCACREWDIGPVSAEDQDRSTQPAERKQMTHEEQKALDKVLASLDERKVNRASFETRMTWYDRLKENMTTAEEAEAEAREALATALEEAAENLEGNPELETRIRAKKMRDIQAAKKIQIDTAMTMAKLLPKHMQEELTKELVAGLFNGNWDYANFELANIGFDLKGFVRGHPESIKNIRACSVDPGNAGMVGFGGQPKNLSAERAIAMPRPDNAYPPDKTFAAANQLHKTSRMQDSSTGTKTDEPSSSVDKTWGPLLDFAKFDGTLPPSIFALASLPRNRPFVRLFSKEIWGERELGPDPIVQRRESLHDDPLHHIPPAARSFFKPATEVAFRLSLVPDEVIEKIYANGYLVGRHDFLPYKKDPKAGFRETHEELAANYNERKHRFTTELFSQADIDAWENAYPHDAARVKNEVSQVVMELTGIDLGLVDTQLRGKWPAPQTGRPRGNSAMSAEASVDSTPSSPTSPKSSRRKSR